MAIAARSRGRSDLVLFTACVVLSLVALALPPATRDPIAGVIRTTVLPPLVGLQYGAQRWRTAWQSHDRDIRVRDSLTLRAVQAQALLSENEQLRKLVGLARRLETGFIPVDALPPADNARIVTTVVLSAGSNAGIRKYSPVIAPEGLVGVVARADPTTSVALLYTNPDFRASAMNADGTATGSIYPHLESGMIAQDRPYLLEMRAVSDRITLTPGTPIFTSGIGGTFPRGIAIGTVLRPLETMEGLSRTYLILPAVNPSRISSVIVLTPERVLQGVGNIWTAAVAIDSATRAIVAAADSLARNAVLLEQRARAAVLDSVRRATIDSVVRALGRPAVVVPDTSAAGRRPPVDTTATRRVPPRVTGDTTRMPSPSQRPRE